MNEPIKICIQRAETRQEWDEMQADYIRRALLSATRIEKLEDELHHCFHRINELQAALREIASVSKIVAKNEDMTEALMVLMTSHRKIALAALEGKND